jgi:preprotein translocase subunit SecD
MRIRVFRFNTYLLAALAAALAAGCQSNKPAYSKKDQASLRLHLEVNPDGSDRNGPVAIGREQPFHLNVETKPFLTEFNIEKAAVIDSLGGFSISVQFDKQGSWLLEQYTASNKGKHMAIAGEFGQMRWLAAPVMGKRIADGFLVFTPDANREEADRLVSGLNRVAALVSKGRK